MVSVRNPLACHSWKPHVCISDRCVTEFYMYRRIMEAIGYFNPESDHFGLDPFQSTKTKGLESAMASSDALAERSNAIADQGANMRRDELEAELKLSVLIALWGNRMDLSLWSGGERAAGAMALAASSEDGEGIARSSLHHH